LLAIVGNRLREPLDPRAPVGVELAQVRDCLLDDLAPHADRANETPVPMLDANDR